MDDMVLVVLVTLGAVAAGAYGDRAYPELAADLQRWGIFGSYTWNIVAGAIGAGAGGIIYAVIRFVRRGGAN